MSIHDYRNPAHFAPPAHPPESAPAPTAMPTILHPVSRMMLDDMLHASCVGRGFAPSHSTPSPLAPTATLTCAFCDDQGVIHSHEGEALGYCECPAGPWARLRHCQTCGHALQQPSPDALPGWDKPFCTNKQCSRHGRGNDYLKDQNSPPSPLEETQTFKAIERAMVAVTQLDCGEEFGPTISATIHAGLMAGNEALAALRAVPSASPLEELLKETEPFDGAGAERDKLADELLASVAAYPGCFNWREITLASALRESLAREAALREQAERTDRRAERIEADARSSVASLTEENATLLRLKEEADDREDSLSQRLAEAEAKLAAQGVGTNAG